MSIKTAAMRVVLMSLIVVGCAVTAGCGNQEREALPEPPKIAHPAKSTSPSARFFERTVFGDGPADSRRPYAVPSTGRQEPGGPSSLVPDGWSLIQIGARCYRRWPPGAWRESAADDVDGLCDAAIFDNPATLFELMDSVGEGLTRVGSSRVNGVETTHYRTGLDIGAVKGAIELWVDDGGLVRRTQQQGASASDFVGVRDYLDFGVAVHVRPPRGKHTNLKELIEGDG
jgi:hypothetical protein